MRYLHSKSDDMLMMTEIYSRLSPVEFSIQSGEFAVREALEHFLAALGPIGLHAEERTAVELVLAEALNNIVEHAYPDTAAQGVIQIRGQLCRDGLHINITDMGEMMPNGKTPLGLAPNVDVNLKDLPEGGFGWFLIRSLVKEVSYDRVDGENRLQLRMDMSGS